MIRNLDTTRCRVYVDLNIFRAGVVSHPSEWETRGYREIQSPPQRYRIIDRGALAAALEIDVAHLRTQHREWVELALQRRELERAAYWSESIAVRSFVGRVQGESGMRADDRTIPAAGDLFVLCEPPAPYSFTFDRKKDPLRAKTS